MRYEKRLLITKEKMNYFNKLLESKSKLKEDDTIINTVNFGMVLRWISHFVILMMIHHGQELFYFTMDVK